MEPDSSPTLSQSLRTFARWAVIAVILYHFAACAVVAFLPQESALRRALPAPVVEYLRITANDNRWDMFHAAPRHHAFDVELVVRSRGQEHVFGAMLPGLRKFDGSLRAHKLFANLGRETNAVYRRAYLRSALLAIEATRGVPVERIWLRYRLERIHRPTVIHKTRQLSRTEVVDLGM